MRDETRELLVQAISALYRDLRLEKYSFDQESEIYDLELVHTKTDKVIRIGFRDKGKRRDFDVIPIQASNAPLGLIQIFTTFVHVYWHAEENNQSILESLSELVADEIAPLDIEEEEKIVH
jgi:hypothetical protein